MGKLGFEYVVAGKLDEKTGKYTEGRSLGEAATFNVSVTANDVKDYGDNRVVETDTSVTGGTVSVELNDMVEELNAFLLGHTYNAEKQNLICKEDDIAPYIGLGAVGISKKGKYRYIAKFYKKVQFREPNDENATQTETKTYGHTTLEGNMFVPEDGIWKEQQTFDTSDDAKAWLDEKLGLETTSTDAGTTEGEDAGEGTEA